ncbi:hypothetical protein M9Y10_002469 [Tritrichomonas musculus]|uniref:Uncharacterized protein n=1 Tax=Tritrichomonas musculus TaxID=1915356 RepID=A0ABR2L9V5_9EUKA
MINYKKPITLLYLKKNSTSWMQISKQTQTIRDSANKKIRMLGNKYYNVKLLFEQLHLKRDRLFLVGRELEEEFKSKKKVGHLLTQAKRMKECIIAWYTEFLYDEIFQKNSIVIRRLLGVDSLIKDDDHEKEELDQPTAQIEFSPPNNQSTQADIIDSNDIEDKKSAILIDNSSLLTNLKFNKEIDSIDDDDYINMENKANDGEDQDQNLNFNFSQLLNF